MEFSSFFSSGSPYALFALLLFLYMLCKTVKTTKHNTSAGKLPPGPRKLPVIGNAHQLVGSLPHRSLSHLAKQHGPLMLLKLGQVPTLIVSSREMARQVVKTHDTNFAQRPLLLAPRILSYDGSGVAFSPYGEYWRQLRKICVVELLTSKRVKSFESVRDEELSCLINSCTSSRLQPINFTEKISSLTYNIIARTAFGQRSNSELINSFVLAMKEMVELFSGFAVADMFPSLQWLDLITGMRYRLEKVFQRTDRILQNIVDDHKEKLTTQAEDKPDGSVEDLVDVLLKIQQHGDLEFPLTDNNIKAVILDIFGAAGETTATTVEWAMSEMLKNPRVMEKAQAEIRSVLFDGKGNVEELKFLKAVVKETLRLHPPFPLLLPRESRAMCKIDEYEIPEKTRVLINAWAIGRDPDYWVEAERFHPERFLDSSIDYKGTDFEYIPFGGGRRICPGILFAMPGIELPLAYLLYHFDWKLPVGMKPEELDMIEGFGLAVGRKQDLHLIPVPYNPSTA